MSPGLLSSIRFIGRFILFLLILLSFMTILVYASSKIKINDKGTILRNVTGNPVHRGGANITRFYEAESNTKPIDILVFGSSRAFRAFDPAIFEAHGLNVHVLASSNQTAMITYHLVNKYVPLLKPKLVILDVHLGLLNNNGLESFYDLSENIPVFIGLLRMALAIDQPTAYFTWYSSLINQLLTPLYKDFSYNPSSEYRKGFIYDMKTDTTLFIRERDTIMLKRRLVPQELKNLKYLGMTIKFLKEQETNVILTRQPILGADPFYADKRVRNLASKNQIRYIDLAR